ncbi:MAG: putative Ig domain-containing protein, partial [Cyanobacteria bacterium J06555_3]
MTLLGISNEGAAGTLRPGEIGTVRLRARAASEGTINITASKVEDDGVPLNYEQFISELGGDLADPAWASAETALKEQFGISWTSFASGLASLATQRSASGVYSHSVNEIWSDVALDAWGDGLSETNVSQAESISNLVSANLAEENAENEDFLVNNLNALPEPQLIEDTQNPQDVQSHLKLAEQIILDGANAAENGFGAVKAATALRDFVNQPGLESPPSNAYLQTLQDNIGEILTVGNNQKKNIVDVFVSYIDREISNEWKAKPASVSHILPPLKSPIDITSKYQYDVPYNSTFHDDGSIISNAIKNSSSYQDKVKNNQAIKSHIEKIIDDRDYEGNNDLSKKPIYINNDQVKGVFGNSDDFSYFDQKKLLKSTLEVIALTSFPNGFTLNNYQQHREQFNQSVLELNDLHDRYFGTTEAAELALLIGRTSEETRQAKVNRINIEQADCHKEHLAYTAEIDFFILDGTTFGADDAPKDEQTEIASILEPLLRAFNFLANPFGGEDYFNRDNINNLLKIGPALGLGWDVQQFGYARPQFNLVKVEETITGTITNPDYKPHDPNCQPPPPPSPPVPPSPLAQTNTSVFVSRDPNDILGPEGFGEAKWIDAHEPMDYTIRFENDPELASAPAQVVKITQQLDSDLDFRTFRVGDFGFGDTLIDVPDNRSFYQTRLDLVEEKGIYLDVFAGIDIAKGEAFWELHSIDPETGEKPSDPLLGFLPPNLTKPEGDGFVTYTVRTDRDIETGTVIDAEATIIFDNNEPIDTPPIFNTIDAGQPTSIVEALPELSESEEFTVNWSGIDDVNGSAIADYTIYVAEDGGELTPWLENTTLTEAVFTGTPGSSYEFYAVARDNAGNVQDLPLAAQAKTKIAGGNNPPVLLNPIGERVAVENSNFSFTIPADVFHDLDAGDVLTYSATLSDGSALPNWLSFDPDIRTLSGTPSKEDVGNLSLKITVTDNANEAISNTFSLEIQNLGKNLAGNSDNNFLRGLVGDDTIDGGAGNDVIRGGAGADVLDGGEGLDILDYRGSTAGVSVNLETGFAVGGDAEGDTFINFERIYGSKFGDSLAGDASNNFLVGFLGNDTIDGGAGNDVIRGGAGADVIDGGEGLDILDYRYSKSGVTANLATGLAEGGDAEGDTFANFERLYGSSFGDDLAGDASNNFLVGFLGNDTIDGGAGNDVIRGGAGADVL